MLYIVILDKGEKGWREFPAAIFEHAKRRAEALADLHGNCKIDYTEKGKMIVRAAAWYTR